MITDNVRNLNGARLEDEIFDAICGVVSHHYLYRNMSVSRWRADVDIQISRHDRIINIQAKHGNTRERWRLADRDAAVLTNYYRLTRPDVMVVNYLVMTAKPGAWETGLISDLRIVNWSDPLDRAHFLKGLV